MNKVELRAELIKDVYMGQGAKAGGYAASTVKYPDGSFFGEIEFFAPGEASQAFVGARKGDSFQIEGRLTKKSEKQADGKYKSTNQILVLKARKAGQAASPEHRNDYANQGITDSDIPF